MSVKKALFVEVGDLVNQFVGHLYEVFDAHEIESIMASDDRTEVILRQWMTHALSMGLVDPDTVEYVRKNPHLAIERISA